MAHQNSNNILPKISDLASQYFARGLNNLSNRDWQSTTPQNHGYGIPFIIGMYVNDIPSDNNVVSYQTNNNTTQTGAKALAAQDSRQGVIKSFRDEVRKQINLVKELPPLALIINPSSLSKRLERPADYARGRRNNIVSMWHESMTVISAEGTTAGQYVYQSAPNGSYGGVYSPGRILSISYQNLLSLVQIYRSNGILYNSNKFNDNGSEGVPIAVGSVYIKYDGYTYIGSFDSFTVTDDAAKPNTLNYSFEFTCRHILKD